MTSSAVRGYYLGHLPDQRKMSQPRKKFKRPGDFTHTNKPQQLPEPVQQKSGDISQQPTSSSERPEDFTKSAAPSTGARISDEMSVPALCLKNVRNSCFANCGLQVLFSIPDFREFFLSRRFVTVSGKVWIFYYFISASDLFLMAI